jgi:hypothetical protein
MISIVKSITDIEDSKTVGYLYIFDASHYDYNLLLELENVVKIGMTRYSIKNRLKQYKSRPKNISFIHCSEPSKRERLMKSYIKETLNIKPVCGSEYFKDCREKIEQVVLYFGLCDTDIINKYYDLYKNKEEKMSWFETINLKYKVYSGNTIQLHCETPLDLRKERIVNLLINTCNSYYVFRGQEGLSDWFLNYACRNDNNDITIECTSIEGPIFSYKDKNGVIINVSGSELTELLTECIQEFKKSDTYKGILEEVNLIPN